MITKDDKTIKISIVTVVFNGETNIRPTIESVLSQNFTDYEFILIDGQSTDNTMTIISEYKAKINVLISEKDTGIYDAMNKGIERANGEWIYFLNAGDVFHNRMVLSKLFETNIKADLIYGKHEADYGYFKRIHTPSNLSSLWKGMIFSHQGMIVRTQLLKTTAFNLSYSLSADYNFIYSLYKNGAAFLEVDVIFATLEAEGTSETNITKTHRQRWRISKAYTHGFKRLNLNLYYSFFLLNLYLKKIVKFVLPTALVRKITRKKYEK
jgi:putative colanic acid biosynthesis glycosyltransferase WcaE